MKRIAEWMERLESVPAVVVSGVFLAAGLLRHLGLAPWLPVDPSWVAVAVCGLPLLWSAIRKLVCNRGVSRISSALLISTAMIAAIAIGDVFAAGEVAFIMAIGEMLEDKTTARARKGLHKLIGLTPQQARRVTAAGEETVPAADIAVGDILRILPGETIPADGEIVAGETSVDQSVMTGESMPVDKAVGDPVFCGTLNRFGAVDLRATRVGEDSSLQKLIRMVQDAEEHKAPIQRAADRWASYLVPLALLIAVAAGVLMRDPVVAVTVLVVFCPCALVLATPTAIMAAIGQATRRGVLIKSGEALETMGRADVIAFDKTGTLTVGEPRVCEIVPLSPAFDENALLAAVAAAERRSEHPLARAILSCAEERGVAVAEPTAFRMEAGRGVVATVEGQEWLCGNAAFLAGRGVSVPAAEGTVVYAATNGDCAGYLCLADTLRPTAAETVRRLHEAGIRTVLLTGDSPAAAAVIAAECGIRDVHAGLLPQEKVAHIAALQEAGHTVCMVGDGVNDAPALKTAAVGVAMGTMGSDIAVEAADVALVGDDVARLPYLVRLARGTARTIRLGITLSLAINFAAIALSLLGWLTPVTGALVHNAGSCFVVLIAALLYDRKFE